MTGEPWFDGRTAGLVGGIGGSLIGVLGGVFGCLCSWLVPKGRGKGLLLGGLAAMGGIGVACLLTAATALAMGQPYHVWYGFLLAGVLLTVLGGVFFGVLRKRYRAAELRKMHASELR